VKSSIKQIYVPEYSGISDIQWSSIVATVKVSFPIDKIRNAVERELFFYATVSHMSPGLPGFELVYQQNETGGATWYSRDLVRTHSRHASAARKAMADIQSAGTDDRYADNTSVNELIELLGKHASFNENQATNIKNSKSKKRQIVPAFHNLMDSLLQLLQIAAGDRQLGASKDGPAVRFLVACTALVLERPASSASASNWVRSYKKKQLGKKAPGQPVM
jgi:hypothetical protein